MESPNELLKVINIECINVARLMKLMQELIDCVTTAKLKSCIQLHQSGHISFKPGIPAELKISERNKRTLKDVEELARKAFQGCENFFISFKVKPGSIIITWYVPESLCEELERLARENAAVLREEGVEEVTIAGEKKVFLSTNEEWLKVRT